MFIGNQKDIYISLVAALGDRQKLSIVKGDSGSGKTYLTEALKKQMPNYRFYKLDGDRYNQMRPYYPFKNLLREVYITNEKGLNKKRQGEAARTILSQMGSFSPLGSDALSACITEFSEYGEKKKKLYNISFTDDEIELLFPLNYFCTGLKPVVFLADDLQYWDAGSLQLLYTLVKQLNESNTFLKDSMIVATVNTSVHLPDEMLSALEQEAGKNVYNLRNVCLEEYGAIMKKLGCTVEFSKELLSALYSITNGNLQLTSDIVLLLQNSSETEAEICKIVESQNLGRLIVERLDQARDDGSLINDALKFGALFGNSFYYHDLETALALQESKVRSLIVAAQDYYLVRSTRMSASFVHELIRETYQKEACDNKAKYYIGFSECMKLLHPGDYLLRAEALFTAGQYEEAWIISLLNAVKEFRSHRFYQVMPRSDDIPTRYKGYLDTMRVAYQAFDNEKYRDSLKALDEIEDIYSPPLLAEKYYLLSLVLSKWLDTRSRVRAKACLEPYLERQNVDNETEVWERIVSAYIIACIHNNEVELAQRYEKELNKSIASRLDFDMEASFRFNTLRRKASSLYSPTVAFQKASASKAFFAPKDVQESGAIPLNPIEYYMSLNNYVAVALMAGKAADVFEDAGILIKLPHDYPYLKFQRYEMPLNNAILVAYLNKIINAEEAERSLRDVLKKCKTENSTSMIVRVNIAVFTALQGEFDSARKQLEGLLEESLQIDNLEFYYAYLIQVNLAAVLYVSGQRIRCIQLLEKLSQDELFKFEEFLELHARALLVSCRIEQGDKLQWYLEMMHLPENGGGHSDDGPWNYYGRKFLFGELEFWSES